MYGRVPRLPIDVLFKNILNDPEIGGYDTYVQSLTKDLQEAIAIAQSYADKEQDRQAELYNRRTKGKSICVGDRVLVSNKRERGKRKIADRWESTVYTVVDVNASTHTYRIKNPSTGQDRVVHRNLLMLANFLPLDVSNEPDHSLVSSCDQSLIVTPGDLDSVEDAQTRTLEWIGCLSNSSCDVSAVNDLCVNISTDMADEAEQVSHGSQSEMNSV